MHTVGTAIAAHLLLGQREGGHLDAGGHDHDGPAVGVGHVQALEPVLRWREDGTGLLICERAARFCKNTERLICSSTGCRHNSKFQPRLWAALQHPHTMKASATKLASRSLPSHLDEGQHRLQPRHQRLQPAVVARALLRRRVRRPSSSIRQVGNLRCCRVRQRQQAPQLVTSHLLQPQSQLRHRIGGQ